MSRKFLGLTNVPNASASSYSDSRRRSQGQPRPCIGQSQNFPYHVQCIVRIRHEWIVTNPMTLVRQSAKREKLPDVLELDELKKLLAGLGNPARALVFLTAASGLRASEALALKVV